MSVALAEHTGPWTADDVGNRTVRYAHLRYQAAPKPALRRLRLDHDVRVWRGAGSPAPQEQFGPGRVCVTTASRAPAGAGLRLGNDGVAAASARAGGKNFRWGAMPAGSEPVTGHFSRPHVIAGLDVPVASGRAANAFRAGSAIDGGVTATLRRPREQRP